jgi:hypothetical protein
MKFVATMFAMACAVAFFGSAGPATAADMCPAEEYIFDSTSSSQPFQCGVHHWSGNKSIKGWQTKSWSSDTALGYEFKTKCIYRSDGDTTYVWGHTGPSYWATFTNWDSGTRHFGTGVIFATGGVASDEYTNSNSCASNKGKIKNSLKRITDTKLTGISGNLVAGQTLTISGTISPSDAPGNVGLLVNDQQVAGAAISKGSFQFKWTAPASTTTRTYALKAAFAKNESKCPAAESWCGWGPSQSDPLNVTVAGTDSNQLKASANGAPYSAGLLSSSFPGTPRASSALDPGVKTVRLSTRKPNGQAVDCPSGYSPLHAELWGGDTDRDLRHNGRGVELKRSLAGGKRIEVQLTCRKDGKGVLNAGRVVLGSVRADKLATGRNGALLFGGPGADSLTISRRGGVVNGGLGADRILVRQPGVVLGGAGADTIRSTTRGRALLVGGAGGDRIVAGGRARIDARDGQRDVVVCRGGKVQVKADRSDILRGACIRS